MNKLSSTQLPSGNPFPESQQALVYIMHENAEWVAPLKFHLDNMGIPYQDWFINQGEVDIAAIPPQGVFYNRMSASSHTRNHRFAVELAGPMVAWLQMHGRRVINNRRALQLEVRKIEQYTSLLEFGIKVPRTIAVNSVSHLVEAASKFNKKPFIIKPNRGGKGTGVHLFRNAKELETFLKREDDQFRSLDGILLVQEYIKPKDGRIVRMEFVNGRFIYAVSVDASGGFELCPADSCSIGDAFCPVGGAENYKFSIIEDFFDPDMKRYENFLQANGIEIGALEFVEDDQGERFIYDVNINTNYNSEAENRSEKKIQGMKEIALYLGRELDKVQRKNERLSTVS